MFIRSIFKAITQLRFDNAISEETAFLCFGTHVGPTGNRAVMGYSMPLNKEGVKYKKQADNYIS